MDYKRKYKNYKLILYTNIKNYSKIKDKLEKIKVRRKKKIAI